jgi:hypothetical protein
MTTTLNVYECRRWSDQQEYWRGAVIVAARDWLEAIKIARDFDGDILSLDKFYTERWPDVYAAGEPGVLYNDEMR